MNVNNEWVEWKAKRIKEIRSYMTMRQKIDKLIGLIDDMEATSYLDYPMDFKEAYQEAMRLATELQKDIYNVSDSG